MPSIYASFPQNLTLSELSKCSQQFQLVAKNIKKRPRQKKRKDHSVSPAAKKIVVPVGLGDDGGSSFATGVRKSRRLTGLVSVCML